MSGKPYVLLLIPVLVVMLSTCNSNPDPDILVIDTFNPTGAGTVDLFLRLVDGTGFELATDDDGNPDQGLHNGYARITYQDPLPSGTYYVEVTMDTAGAGIYALRILDYDPGSVFPVVAADPDTPPDGDDGTTGGIPDFPVAITLGEVKSRAINPDETDVDWFVFILP